MTDAFNMTDLGRDVFKLSLRIPEIDPRLIDTARLTDEIAYGADLAEALAEAASIARWFINQRAMLTRKLEAIAAQIVAAMESRKEVLDELAFWQDNLSWADSVVAETFNVLSEVDIAPYVHHYFLSILAS